MTGTFFSLPQSAFFTGQNQQVFGDSVKKPSFFGDFSAEFEPFQRFRLVESVKTYNFHVSSSAFSNFVFLQFEPILATGIQDQFSQLTPLNSFMSFDNFTQELQGMFYVTQRLMARLGHRFERREIAVDLGETSSNTTGTSSLPAFRTISACGTGFRPSTNTALPTGRS